ncbi:MAG: hypothetical protein IID32_07565 [Planctomycetes bacterium]|nr:hypothetical protein [Planctomycetota bacterium]
MFKRRLVILVCLLVLTMGLLGGRLVWLQIIQGPHYHEKTQIALQLPPRWLKTIRATIYDNQYRELAVDRPSFELCLHYHLTRLYDERFWIYEQQKYLRRKQNRSKSLAQARQYVEDQFSGGRPAADKILQELADVCGIPVATLQQAVRRINGSLYDLRTAMARKAYYREHGLEFVAKPNIHEIRRDLARLVPNRDERITLIYRQRVAEMNEPLGVLTLDSKDVAMTIEERFGGGYFEASNPARVVQIRSGQTRVYPYRGVACHLIGQLGPLRPGQVQSRPVSQLPAAEQLTDYFLGDRQGAWGIEQLFEKTLRGHRGWLQKDIQDRVITQIPVTNGTEVVMSIDIELQREIQDILLGNNPRHVAYQGAVVVIDVPTGKVRAMVSVPTFDLNTIWQEAQYRRIVLDQDKRFWPDRALGRNYQAGSTIKPSILIGAIQDDVVNPATKVTCDFEHKTWPGGPSDIHNHGPTDASEAIVKSCNLYFIKLGQLYGPQRLTPWLKQMGWGRRILAWPGASDDELAVSAFREARGHIAPVGRVQPGLADLRFISIGRGALDGSVLQIANSVATIARDGFFMKPSLIESPKVDPASVAIASNRVIKIIQDAMRDVIYDSSGTAYDAGLRNLWPQDQVTLYGKTGSTDYSLFACYAKGADGSSLAIAVLAEVEAMGGQVAAPLTGEVLLACARHGYLPQSALSTQVSVHSP